VADIQEFRRDQIRDETAPLFRVRANGKNMFEELLDKVELTLIRMPLPRLQWMGRRMESFVYSIGWDKNISPACIRAYQRGDIAAFDNRISLQPGVGEHLVRLNSLLRPLLYRQWTADVANLNNLAESRLEAFLFGADRIYVPAGLRQGLLSLQGESCFYCREKFESRPGLQPEVDHFIPWARYPDNAIENLVVAHQHCNNDKRDFLAALPHVTHWLGRFGDTRGHELAALSQQERWASRPHEIRGVATAIYLRLPAEMELWAGRKRFEPFDRAAARLAFGVLD
jgi:hypothetical protein